MFLRKVILENVRSFLDRSELRIEGKISILIGPNGGGKTNLLDAIVIILRRHLFASRYPAHAPKDGNQDRYEFRHNDILNNMILGKYAGQAESSQLVEVELEVTSSDIENIKRMKEDAALLAQKSKDKYFNTQLVETTSNWDLQTLHEGMRFRYSLRDGNLQGVAEVNARCFLQYLQLFEVDNKLRDEFGLGALKTPMIYLPVNRSTNGFQSSVQLPGFNESEAKRQIDGALSSNVTPLIPLAIGRLAQRYRLMLEEKKPNVDETFRNDENLKELTNFLAALGYDWNLVTVDALKNHYDIQLRKQGSTFSVSAASSGERELLTYLFAIFALNVRDAVIVVDEPELHLHPKWQTLLLKMFERLAGKTNNQFLLATHAPTFVSPKSIQYVSRVFSREQKSHIVRLKAPDLPDAKHLFSIVNSQNNERVFFADHVILVEGLSDRIFFEAMLKRDRGDALSVITEVIDVGGKNLFASYTKLLASCKVSYSIIADLDFIEEVGSPEVKLLLAQDDAVIKRDVIDNIKSRDGGALVASIEQAMSSGDWSHPQGLWEYIKGRHRKLRSNLNVEEEKLLDDFIALKRSERIYILRNGALEEYLPDGYRAKDLNKLIAFVSQARFWEQLAPEARKEVEEILKLALG